MFISGCFSLSVLDIASATGKAVKHYRIMKLHNGGVYISLKKVFNDVFELVDNYKSMMKHPDSNLQFISKSKLFYASTQWT